MIALDEAYYAWLKIRKPEEFYGKSIRMLSKMLRRAAEQGDEITVVNAVRRFEEIIRNIENTDDVVYGAVEAARALYGFRKFEMAETLLQQTAIQCAEDFPSYAIIQLILGIIYYDQAKYKNAFSLWGEARQTLRQLVESYSDFSANIDLYKEILNLVPDLSDEELLILVTNDLTSEETGRVAQSTTSEQIYIKGIEISSPEKIRITISLPPLITLDKYFKNTSIRLWSIEYIYLVYALLFSGDIVLIRRFLSFIRIQKDENISESQFRSFLESTPIEPLRLVSSHYGSDGSFDLLGLGSIIAQIRETVEFIWYGGKHKKRMAEHEERMAEYEERMAKIKEIKEILKIDIHKVNILNNLGLLDDDEILMVENLSRNYSYLIDSPIARRVDKQQERRQASG